VISWFGSPRRTAPALKTYSAGPVGRKKKR